MATLERLHLDFGNAFLKWRGGGRFGAIRHAIAPLSENEWRGILERGKPPFTTEGGYIKVNGIGYAIGNQARRHLIRERPRGSARYSETYYGIGLAYIMALAFDKPCDVDLIASYAPRDVEYAKDLKASARKVWNIEIAGDRRRYHVKTVEGFDEPIAGFTNAVYTSDGKEKRETSITLGSTLTIDVGGYTTDAVAVDDGDIDLSSLRSAVTGALDTLEWFERELRANNRQDFKGVGDLDPKLVEKAILQKVFYVGKKEIICAKEANEAINTLTNRILDVIMGMGGYVNYNRILLTGGGSVLVHEALQIALPNAVFELADNVGEMMFANVKGLEKIGILLDKE